MIRLIGAFVWLRWRLLRNTLGVARPNRRDSLEQLSRALAFVVPLVVVVLSLGSVAGMAVAGFIAGRVAGSGRIDPAIILLIVRAVLLFACVLLLVFAVLSPTQSALAQYTRLLLLPISKRALHLVEVVAALADPWLMAMAPGLAMFALGLAVGGRPKVALVALAAGGAMLVLIASAAALISFLVGWLMKDRRRSEMFTLLFVCGLAVVSLMPALLSSRFARPAREKRAQTPTVNQSAEQFNDQLPVISRVLPSELYGRAIQDAMDRRPLAAAAGIAGLLAEGAVLFFLSGRVHRRVIDAADSHRGMRAAGRLASAGFRLPLLGDAASAVAFAQLRTALRSIRGRLIVLMPGPMLSLVTFVSLSLPNDRWGQTLAGRGYLLLGMGSIMALYTLQAFTMNLFGTDRAGLSLQFLSPVSDRDLARGKIAGLAMVYSIALVLCLGGALFVVPGGSPWLWAAALLSGYATFLWISPFAVWFSALFPVAADLTKTGTGGNPHALSMLVGTLLTVLLAAPCAGAIALAGSWLHRPVLAFGLVLVWFLVGAAVAHPLVGLASRTIAARRENLAIVAQGR
jgi:hypothetical protein